ncbi:hypothetical protein C8F04DRAFT_1151741 [Mycena alexandri]|uniref:Uncharacterized protein n=1 Tax=Mycena alexandri TaxID=1745969 RepID=A0AAD6WRL6_9AGAR|nr:hypothetical protein C8F04DRAFT_1151741 [Mycena alexandri]
MLSRGTVLMPTAQVSENYLSAICLGLFWRACAAVLNGMRSIRPSYIYSSLVSSHTMYLRLCRYDGRNLGTLRVSETPELRSQGGPEEHPCTYQRVKDKGDEQL